MRKSARPIGEHEESESRRYFTRAMPPTSTGEPYPGL